jgi:hypothetical protein
MIVAWQFIARSLSDNGSVSASADVIRRVAIGLHHDNATVYRKPNHIRRGGDGPGFARIPGSELPGYDHSVPPGQALSLPSPIAFFARSRLWPLPLLVPEFWECLGQLFALELRIKRLAAGSGDVSQLG